MADRVTVAGRTMWLESCCNCKTAFAMSDELHATALERREAFQFYCPNGHGQWYTSGEREVDIIRRERDRLKQSVAYYEDRTRELDQQRALAVRQTAAARGQITKLKKRAAAGLCPCCNRPFENLARHMATKHPSFVSEPDATETVTVN